jgi:hypothetical protein
MTMFDASAGESRSRRAPGLPTAAVYDRCVAGRRADPGSPITAVPGCAGATLSVSRLARGIREDAMTTTSHPAAVPSAVGELATERRLYRLAGLGGVFAVASWLAQPVLVGILSASEGDTAPTFEGMEGRPYSGALEALIFLGMCGGLLVFVEASARLMRSRAGSVLSTWAEAGVVLGLLGAACWALVAGVSLAPYTSIGPGLAEFAPEPDHQVAILGSNALAIAGLGFAGLFGLAGYVVCLTTTARRAGVLGWPTSVAGFAALSASLLPLALPSSPPWGFLGLLGFVLVAGIVFLVRSRRPRRTADAR